MNKLFVISIWGAGMAAIVMTIASCVLTNELAATGKELQKLDYEISHLKDTNTLLSEEIASRSSILAIQTQAQLLGLTPTVHSETLSPLSVALQTVR